MKLNFNKAQGFTLPITFYPLINDEIEKANITTTDTTNLTFNFCDDDYSAETGGYHPVEIRLEKHKEKWGLVYITDFTYSGGPYPELIKDIDICFHTKRVFSLYNGWLNITSGKELVELFINNFIEYHSMNTYTVKISFE